MLILQFLLDHLFFIVVAIAIVFSLMNKVKQAVSQAEQRVDRQYAHEAKPMSNTQQTGTLGNSASYGTAVSGHGEERNQDYSAYPAMPQQATQQQITRSHNNHRTPLPSRSAQRMDSLVNTSHITKHQIAQGVIWSEILGRPRAHNPYRPPRYRN